PVRLAGRHFMTHLETPRSKLRRSARVMAALFAATLVVTGCSAGPLVPDSQPDADPSASVAPPEDAAPVITREQCVVGTWQVDNEAFESYMNSFIPKSGVQMSISGGNFMRFDDAGTFFGWRDDFTMTT